MRETANDRTIVQLVYAYRVLSQPQLERLLGRSASTVQRLLRRLYDHAYLERVFLPVARFGSSPALYILDREGVVLLRKLGLADDDFTGIPGKDLSPMFLEHTLALNEVRIAIQLACQARGWVLEQWLTENELKADYDRVRLRGERKPVALIPDSFLTINVPGRGATHLFIELDRGTMQTSRFKQKVEAYVAYYRSGAYNRRFSAQGFRVLTVVEGVGAGRVESLLEATAKVAGIGRRFWFAHLGEVTQASVLSAPIWRIAGENETAVLIAL